MDCLLGEREHNWDGFNMRAAFGRDHGTFGMGFAKMVRMMDLILIFFVG